MDPFFVSNHVAFDTIAFSTSRIVAFVLFSTVDPSNVFLQLGFRGRFVAANVTRNVFDIQMDHFFMSNFHPGRFEFLVTELTFMIPFFAFAQMNILDVSF